MKHKLLVYGTLKQNFYNHFLLKVAGGESAFIKNTRTRFPTYSMKENGVFPAVFFKSKDAHFISGELFLVSDEVLSHCDRLEDHPVWFQRRRIPIIGTEECWMYVMRNKFIEDFPIDTRIEQNTQRF